MNVWERRIGQGVSEPLAEAFNASIELDSFLWKEEIEACLAYAQALFRAGIISLTELKMTEAGLEKVKQRIEGGEDLSRFEDIHSAVELMLQEEIGMVGQKLATGRSRNEQVVTIEKLYLKKKLPAIMELIRDLQETIIEQAEKYHEVIIPGYTHLRSGQYILFSHYLMSFFWPLERARARLLEAGKRLDKLPLGAGALAGSTAAIDREFLKDTLGFTACTENSLDTVADRSFILEVLFILALLLLDLSRIAEDLVIFSSPEFGLIEMKPGLETSSSLMPQKKNPDILELLRASCGRLFGYVSHLFIVLKGLPYTYNKDMQEDKIPLRQGVEDTRRVLEIFNLTLRKISPGPKSSGYACDPLLIATDLVDYLVAKGIPFREAHGLVGEIVRYAESKEKSLAALTQEEFRKFSDKLASDVYQLFDPRRSVEMKKTVGSTHPDQVREQILMAKEIIGQGKEKGKKTDKPKG